MYRTLFGCLLASSLAGLVAVRTSEGAAPAKAEDELVDKVQKAIVRARQYLKSHQTKAGNWEGVVLGFLADQKGGSTALATLALLNAGDTPRNSPEVARAVEYLRSLPPERTYIVGLQTMVFAELREKKDLPLIERNKNWLLANALMKDGKLQGWSYPQNSVADNSNTQYALLGLYAAKQSGIRVPDDKWKLIQDFYVRNQQAVTGVPTEGYWSYHNVNFGDPGQSFSMTVAGVCGLIISGMGLDVGEQQLDDRTGVARNCGAYGENAAAAKGMNWITDHFGLEPKSAKSIFYSIYGLERLGRLSGQRFVGAHDWYREGCDYLVRVQESDGSYGGKDSIDALRMVSTSFALLFLSKGRTPVLVSKFAWGDFANRGNGSFAEKGGDREGVVNWNRKHNDVRHLVEFASQDLFKGEPLAWQVYDVRRLDLAGQQDRILEEVGTLVQSPIVYLNGHTSPMPWLNGVQKEILKRYIEEGGFVLAEACCGDEAFAAGFRELMKELFPDNDLRKMPPEHPIWRSFADVSPADFPDLESLERGCKTVVVFSPKPLAGYWEEQRFVPERGKPARNEGERAFRLAGNVVAYATGLELPKPRGTVAKLAAGKEDARATRSYLQAAQLRVEGEAEPAPAAMRNLMTFLRDRAGMEVRTEKKSFFPADDNLFGFKFMYLHGRKSFAFDQFALENVRSNLERGGTLLADACCGKPEFDNSFREMAAKLFPGQKLAVIPADDFLYSAKLNGGEAISSVRCRREKKEGGPEPEMRNFAPYLEGIKVDGRWAVIYSKYDLGCALEGHKSSDCLGHDKESALRIGAAAVFYALKR